ncbi:MAG TPA: altronate dehydratase family protein [Acidimicrobiales bacterium]|nr:altronate dehydratase family protein [Acidimicrobiales bacterium]
MSMGVEAAPLRLRPGDTVAVAIEATAAGTTLVVGDLRLQARDDIPAGHKVALAHVATGGEVRKYGQVIGVATQDIEPGEHVHSHNLAFAHLARDYHYGAERREEPDPVAVATFRGIVRPDGQVATRNYLGIITSVNCSATVARMVAAQLQAVLDLDEAWPSVDGVVALTHGSGCGMAGSGEGFELLRRTLSGYAAHPNFAGLLVLGLGCEVNQVRALTEGFDVPAHKPVLSMTIQEMGGTRATVRAATERLQELAQQANRVSRTEVPASKLVLGLECGGSDAYSGMTANPALGVAADLLIDQGGTAILGETPEIYGAEHLLAGRAASAQVGRQLIDRVRWWEDYVKTSGASLDNNPSPGNKAGGLTTILEKSLGAVAKGGSRSLRAVYGYAERVSSPGLVFMDTPGYDPVSVTGMVAGGANVVCFTTGRGSVFGSKPAPCIKLCTNTGTFRRMEEDMDVNCGTIIDGESSVEQVGRQIFDMVLAVASGQRTKSEQLGFGDEEFTPWQLGAVL